MFNTKQHIGSIVVIYFIVNNNYHTVDFYNHISTIDSDVVLIEIPHTLDEHEHKDLKLTFKYVRSSRRGVVANVIDYLKITKRMNHEITPTREDVLFFYTEYEILNQYLASCFKRVGARVYLIEDGGLGTYVPFRLVDGERLSLKDWIKQSIYRLLPGLSKIRFHKLNGHVFHWMPDTSIDGVCIYYPVELKRPIPTILLQPHINPQLRLIQSRAVFLNEPIYGIYQNAENYLAGLQQIIGALYSKFDELFFKFHPRENDEWRGRIRNSVLVQFPKVVVIEDAAAIESIVEKYQPTVAASYFCSALLSLSGRGIEPLYLYHLLPELNQLIISQEVTSVLSEIGYNFISGFSEIDSRFKSGLSGKSRFQGAITLSALVSQK